MNDLLKSLTLFKHEEKAEKSALESARDNLLKNLAQQLSSAEATLKGETFTIERTETVEEDGVKKKVKSQRPIRKWYWTDADGNMRFNLRHANKRFDIEKGKPDIVVGAKKDLPKVIETIVEIVKKGGFDKALKTAIEERAKAKASNS